MGLMMLVGAFVGALTFIHAKQRRKDTGTAVAYGLATGAGSAAATALVLGLLPVALVVGAPLALGYYIGKTRRAAKALKPSE